MAIGINTTRRIAVYFYTVIEVTEDTEEEDFVGLAVEKLKVDIFDPMLDDVGIDEWVDVTNEEIGN